MIGLRGRHRPAGVPAAATLAVICAGPVSQASTTPDEQRSAIVDKAHWFEQRGQLEQAQELLSRATALAPEDELLVVARAEAYLLDKNPFWALKVLGELIERKPPACSARALAARAHIAEANLEQAARMLEAPKCDRLDESRLRFALLRLELAELNGERAQVNEQFRLAKSTSRRYEEDDLRLLRLAQRYDPWYEPSFAFKLDLGVGWSSSGLGSVPLDLAWTGQRSSSSLLGMDLEARFIPAQFESWHPVVEVEAHLAQYLESPVQALSSRQPVWRLGAELGGGPRRLLVAYAGDVINLDGGTDYPNDTVVYSSGHRLEYRIGLERAFFAYGALGRRQFWLRDRTRLEAEQGLSKSIALSETMGLSVGATSRVYIAEHRAYDQFGAGANAALTVDMPKGFELRESVSVAYDLFPRSEGYFTPETPERRRDTLLRVGVGVSAPYIMGLRLGLTYGYASRASNADAHDYTDHRGILTVTWQSNSDRLKVSRIPKSGRVPLAYPDDEASAGTNKYPNIVETIRQNETQRQNSSCLK